MRLIPALVRASLITAIAALLIYSIRSPSGSGGESVTLLMEPDGTGVWRDLVNQFNSQYPGTPVRLIEGPPATNTREDLYSTAFLSGDSAFDVVYADSIWIAKFAAAGWLVDLTGRVSAEDRADFLPAEFDAGSYQGRLYRMPALTDAGVLFYRTDLVDTPPDTFADLVNEAQEHTTADRFGFLWQGKQYEGLVTVYLEILWGHGGEWIDPATRSVLLDRPAALEALRLLKATIGDVSPPAVTTYAEEDTRILFQSGRAVLLRNWPYVWSLAQQAPAIAGKIAMIPMVHAPGHSSAATLGGWGFAISRYSRDADRAWQFIEFLTRPEQLEQVQRRQGRIPARRSMIPPEFLPILEVVRSRPQIPEYAQASDILQRWLSAALTDRVSPESALKQAAEETRRLLGDPQ